MKKKLLIEVNRENIIQCDTPGCGYVIPNTEGGAGPDGREYINQPCPKCGANLLTEQDYILDKKMMKTINWLNKWFSWLTYLSFSKKEHKATIHAKDGKVNIENK